MEGRLWGVPTTFVSEKATPRNVMALRGHVFVNREYTRVWGWDAALALLDMPDTYVSVSVDAPMLASVPDDIWRRAHVMLCMEVPELEGVWHLFKPSDSLRLDFREFSNATVAIGQFWHAWPADYAADRPVIVRP